MGNKQFVQSYNPYAVPNWASGIINDTKGQRPLANSEYARPINTYNINLQDWLSSIKINKKFE